MQAYLLVAIGGALGSMLRHWLSVTFHEFDIDLFPFELMPSNFPWATLGINVSGSLLIGFIANLPVEYISRDARLFFMTGVLGGYTTFSSFSLQTLNLLRDREWLYAGGNVILSVVLCMIAVWLGWLLGDMFNSMKGN